MLLFLTVFPEIEKINDTRYCYIIGGYGKEVNLYLTEIIIKLFLRNFYGSLHVCGNSCEGIIKNVFNIYAITGLNKLCARCRSGEQNI